MKCQENVYFPSQVLYPPTASIYMSFSTLKKFWVTNSKIKIRVKFNWKMKLGKVPPEHFSTLLSIVFIVFCIIYV